MTTLIVKALVRAMVEWGRGAQACKAVCPTEIQTGGIEAVARKHLMTKKQPNIT